MSAFAGLTIGISEMRVESWIFISQLITAAYYWRFPIRQALESAAVGSRHFEEKHRNWFLNFKRLLTHSRDLIEISHTFDAVPLCERMYIESWAFIYEDINKFLWKLFVSNKRCTKVIKSTTKNWIWNLISIFKNLCTNMWKERFCWSI